MPESPTIDVTVHRHGRDAPLRITDKVVGLRWSHSIAAPWQSLTVAWKAAVRDSFSIAAGDWVVVRAGYGSDPAKGPAIAWGRVDDIDGGATMQPTGVLVSDTISIKCSSWWSLLHQANLYSVKGWADDIGTLLSMQTWSRTLGSVINDYSFGSLARALQRLFSALAAIELPGSMVGGQDGLTLGDVIPLVHNWETRDYYAPERVVDKVDIGGGVPQQLSSKLASYEASIGELLTGSFVPEPLLIELFPSFERFPERQMVQSNASPASSTTAALTANPALADFLGGWETLIYRIKPFRDRPLGEAVVAYPQYKHAEVEKAIDDSWFTAALRATAAQIRTTNRAQVIADTASILQNNFKDLTFGYSGLLTGESAPSHATSAYPRWIDKTLLRSISFTRSDKSRMNASTIVLSPDPSAGGIDAIKDYGLPITYDEEIRRHGLRLLKPTWTFVIPNDAAPSANVNNPNTSFYDKAAEATRNPAFIPFMRTICAQLMQFYKNNHLYSTGTLQLNLLEAWRLGGAARNQTFFEKVLDLKAGQTVAVTMHDNESVFYAYAESVDHSFSVADGGIKSASTSLSYTRGHFGVMEDALGADVPLRDVAASTTSQKRTGSRGRSRAGLYQEINCDMGEATNFPANRDGIVWSNVPVWLIDWAVSRGFTETSFSMSNTTALHGALSMREHSIIAAAHACVIEYYWRQIDRNAAIKIIPGTGHIRSPVPGEDLYERHTSGAGFDFSVYSPTYQGGLGWDYIPAYQSWGALYRLVEAGRIPKGAKGLYLNISQYTGPDPTLPQNAGLPTRRKGSSPTSPPYPYFPAGGSGGTHYDYSGTFGFVGNNYDYVWACDDGDGEDEWKYEVHHSTMFTILGTHATNYFLAGGRNDTHLHEVGPKVPNVLQVLGQVPSCFADSPPGGSI